MQYIQINIKFCVCSIFDIIYINQLLIKCEIIEIKIHNLHNIFLAKKSPYL